MKKILFFITLILFFLKPLPAFAAEGCRVFDDTGDGSECAGTEYPSPCPGPTSYCCVDAQACDDHYMDRYATATTWTSFDPIKYVEESSQEILNEKSWHRNQMNNTIAYLGSGANAATGFAFNSVNSMYASKPASTSKYLAYLGQQAQIVPQAYAQGLGFSALNPVLEIWKASRNFAYLGFTLMFIITGILIMIRQKIDPQTVISLQQALPRLVITLLLITFSYAIAGFIIDLMYVLINLSIQLFKTFGLYENIGTFQNQVMGKSIFVNMLEGMFTKGTGGTIDAIGNIIKDITGDSDQNLFGRALEIIGQPLAWIIIAFMMLYAGFKTFIILLMAYVKLIIGVIVGPIQIMLNAFPGSDSFKKWLMSLLSNVAPFVIVVVMLLLAGTLTTNTSWGAAPDKGFKGEVGYDEGFESWKVPLINISHMESFIALLGLGLIMLMPTAAQMAQDFFKVEAFKYGTAIGEASKWGLGAAKSPYDYWRAREEKYSQAKLNYLMSGKKGKLSRGEAGLETGIWGVTKGFVKNKFGF